MHQGGAPTSLVLNPLSLSHTHTLTAASLSSTLRFFSPKLPLPFLKPKPSSSFYFPLSFQPLSSPSPPSPSIRFRAQTQTQTQTEPTSVNLPPNLQRIVTLFQSVPDPKSKYQQLLHYGTQLPPYPPQFRDDDHRVRGCVSQVWVRAYPDADDPTKVRFDADSDSSLTKGLAALLVFGLSGESPGVVAAISPEFVQLLGLKQSLTPSRNNGFLNMLKLMQEKAAVIGGLDLGRQGGILTAETADLGQKMGGSEVDLEIEEKNDEEEDEILNEENEVLGEESGGFDDVSLGANGGAFGGRRERIRERLERELSPVELEVEDVSHLHAGHAGVRGNSGGETHFNLRVVSKEFEGKSMVKRHRLVYDLLREELDSGLHALSIVAKTPGEV